ncbi:MAG: helix-turn-helix transcriptional regulator [Pseudomonas sp.]
MPLLVVPLAGRKRLRNGAEWLDCSCGAFLMLHRAQAVDVENIPEADAAYRALTIAFPWRVVEIARAMLAMHPRPTPLSAASASVGPVDSLGRALQAYLAAEPGEPLAVDHGALGVLLALAQAGHDGFRSASDPSLAARVRLMVTAAPAQDWQSARIEEALCISGATLRRRLQEEGTSLRAVLLEARLHHGLTLLQTTAQSVKSAAAACGYSSVPSFSRAFGARFGIEPSAIARG